MARARAGRREASPEARGIADADEGSSEGLAEGGELASPEGSSGEVALNARIAAGLKDLRRARGYSLDELAARSGVSRASLSQIETAKTNPTLSILWKIATGLGVPFARLLGQEHAQSVSIQRRPDQHVLRSQGGGLESRLCNPAGTSRQVELYELKLLPKALHFSDPHAPGTQELIVVLAGSLRLRVGDATYDLGAGDSAYFAADVPHGYENVGRVLAKVHDLILYAR